MTKQKKKRKIDLLFITATISTMLVLLLIGILSLLLLTAGELSHQLRQEMTVEIVLEDDIDDMQLSALTRRIESAPYCMVCTRVSKEDALDEMTRAMGTDPTMFLDYNPFYASLNVRLESDYACSDSLKWISESISEMEGVRDVTWQKEILDIVNSNIRKVSAVLLAMTVILALISFSLINNTIKLTIYSQRFILYSMKLVGAKWSFIRRPFVSSNLLIGVTAAILSCAAIWLGLKWATGREPWLGMLLEKETILPVFAIVTLVGLFMTWICAFHSVNRFLRMKSGELHYV